MHPLYTPSIYTHLTASVYPVYFDQASGLPPDPDYRPSDRTRYRHRWWDCRFCACAGHYCHNFHRDYSHYHYHYQ